jgi:hypothetical protein
LAQRELLMRRLKYLLESFKHHDNKEIAAIVADMLAAYDVAQAKQLTAAERKVALVTYVRELQGVPTWAVQEACNRIRLGTAPDISHHFKPTPIQVRVLAVSIAQPWKAEALQIGEILGAEQYHEGPSEEERGRVAIKWRALSEALKGRADGDDGGLNRLAQVASEEAEKEKALISERLRRSAENTEAMIRREWTASGEKPPEGVLVSRSLVKLMEEWKKARAAEPPEPEKMVL